MRRRSTRKKFLKEYRNNFDYDRAGYLIKEIIDLKNKSSKEEILKKLIYKKI